MATQMEIDEIKDFITQAVQAGKSETSGLVAHLLAKLDVEIEKSINKNVNGKLDKIRLQLASQDVVLQEIKLEQEKKMPIRHTYIDPEALKAAPIIWYCVVTPKEKETSAFFKLLFREQLGDVMSLMQFGIQPNPEELKNEFSRVWRKSKGRMFLNSAPAPQVPGEGELPADARGRSIPKGQPALPGGIAALGQ